MNEPAKGQRRPRGRANGEGSIFPYRGGYAAYVWVSTPEGVRKRRWVYGKNRDEVYEKWLKLHSAAKAGPVATRSQTLGGYFRYWLAESWSPTTRRIPSRPTRGIHGCTSFPGLGRSRLDKFSIRHVRAWLNETWGVPDLPDCGSL